MGKQWVLDAYHCKRPERVPWVPYVGVHAAYLIGVTADKFFQDADLIAKGVLYAAKRYQADGIPLLFDLNVEAQAMGLKVKWLADNPPTVAEHPLADKTWEQANLSIPTAKDGRWPVIIEAGKRVKAEIGDVALLGLLCGPLTLAAHLRGAKLFTDLYKSPDEAKKIVDFAGEVGAEAARIYRDIGCDIICIVDPVSSQIRPETFVKFVTPACQPAIKVIHEAGLTSSYWCCGDATKVLEVMCQIGTHSIAIDEQLNLAYVRDVALKHGVGFGGNLKLTLALSLGILSPREDALVSLATGGAIGYTFAPG